jgi:dephospho-CoA kinase
MSKKIGLTGGIGSGKSMIARIFSLLNIPIYYADNQAKKAVYDPFIQTKIIQEIGTWCYNSEGIYDTKKIASFVFEKPAYLKKLTNIIYPWLENDFIQFTAQHQHKPYIIKEAAVLLETGMYQQLDGLIIVFAPLIDRIEWLKNRRMTQEEIEQRIKNQWTDEQRFSFLKESPKKENFSIQNSKQNVLIPQILKIHQTITIH